MEERIRVGWPLRYGTESSVILRLWRRHIPFSLSQEFLNEVAQFHIQKIKNLDIKGKEYQIGEQLRFWNVREYVLFRDGYRCQCCNAKSKNPILNVHQIESPKTGGDAPGNLIPLCEVCHQKHQQGEVTLKVKRQPSFRDAAFMGIMGWPFYNKLKNRYPNITLTYGYQTKYTR